MDESLIVGEFIRTLPGGPIYRVDAVSESRARCVLVSAKALNEEWVDEKSGRIINISPNSVVLRVDKKTILKEAEDRYRKKVEMSEGQAVGIPVAETSIREREKNRRTEMAAKKAKTNGGGVALVGAAKRAKENKKDRPPKTVRACLCGCGEETTGYFAPGHDARFKAWMVKVERGTMEMKDLPKAVQKAYEFKKRGAGFVTATNYKGEKHSGYDRHA